VQVQAGFKRESHLVRSGRQATKFGQRTVKAEVRAVTQADRQDDDCMNGMNSGPTGSTDIWELSDVSV
jgi:hypothetical protein